MGRQHLALALASAGRCPDFMYLCIMRMYIQKLRQLGLRNLEIIERKALFFFGEEILPSQPTSQPKKDRFSLLDWHENKEMEKKKDARFAIPALSFPPSQFISPAEHFAILQLLNPLIDASERNKFLKNHGFCDSMIVKNSVGSDTTPLPFRHRSNFHDPRLQICVPRTKTTITENETNIEGSH